MAGGEYNKGWVYRYDFENGDCYVGKDGAFNPMTRAVEHIQDALVVAYPEKYAGFKAMLRGDKARFVTINTYTEQTVQRLGWQWGLSRAMTHEDIDIKIKKKQRTKGDVQSVYWSRTANGNDSWTRDIDVAKTHDFQNFKKIINQIYDERDKETDDARVQYSKDFQDMAALVKDWKYTTVDYLRDLFQVTSDEIEQLKKINESRDADTLDLTKVIGIVFGKEGNKKQDWINIFSGATDKSILDTCEMFATLNAYYQLSGRVNNSEGQSGQMLNNEVLKANFDTLITGQWVKSGAAVMGSLDFQKALVKDEAMKDAISTVMTTGTKPKQKNIKVLYSTQSSSIAAILARRIKNASIWDRVPSARKEMFEKTFDFLTSSTFFPLTQRSSYGKFPD